MIPLLVVLSFLVVLMSLVLRMFLVVLSQPLVVPLFLGFTDVIGCVLKS
jgi:hypothetical protein